MIKKTTVEYSFDEEGEYFIPLSSHVTRVSPDRMTLTGKSLRSVQTFGGLYWIQKGDSWYTDAYHSVPCSVVIVLSEPGDVALEVIYGKN